MHEFPEALDFLVSSTNWDIQDVTPLILSAQAGSSKSVEKYICFSGFITADGLTGLSCAQNIETANLLFDKEYKLFKPNSKTSLMCLIMNGIFFQLKEVDQQRIIKQQGGQLDARGNPALYFIINNSTILYSESVQLLTQMEVQFISWYSLSYKDHVNYFTEKLKTVKISDIFQYYIQSNLYLSSSPKIFGSDIFGRGCYMTQDIFNRSQLNYQALTELYKQEYQCYSLEPIEEQYEEADDQEQ
ncbi:hypothetical protein SS50377_23024 [Spironucleus salmonicida]|uniref:Uncharacterized protein n=1 Tax=Spironucleus salmonicida TaxID=348837 RepID=V6LSF5_9EUKA|nr:hypothetical protein SS50377_23024 [Spironucleus salmonicida]|eukprot:EST47602.1 Hypothetical protein SS50377_12297 [Spironucleus salmonicida]